MWRLHIPKSKIRHFPGSFHGSLQKFSRSFHADVSVVCPGVSGTLRAISAEVEPFHFDPTIVERQYDRRESGNDGTDEGNRVDGEPFKVTGYKSTSTKELLQTSAEGRRLGPISQGWFPLQLDAPLFGTTDRDPA